MDLPFLANLSNIDLIILIGAGLLFLVMAYMIFKQVMKAIIIGVIFAAIPVVLYLLGVGIDLSLQTIIWFGLFGIATYFVYDVVSGWFKLLKIVTLPIRKLMGGGKGKPKEEKKDKKEDSKKNEKEKA